MGTKEKQLLVSVRHILLMVILQLVGQYRLVCEGVRSFQKHAVPTYGGNPPVKTVKHSNGDVVDCADFYDQPAFEHPLLKDQKIKAKLGLMRENPALSARRVVDHDHVQQNTEKICPDGTVPILRQAMEKSSNATPGGSLKHVFSSLHSTLEPAEEDGLGALIMHAFYGAEDRNIHLINATINIWNPVVRDRETSLMYIAAATDDDNGSVAVGWMVNYGYFGDQRTRLFVSWSGRGGEEGCDNLSCPGFVQTTTTTYLGSTLQPISTYGGKSYEDAFALYQSDNRDWWVSFHGEVLGYFPAALMPDLTGEFGSTLAVFGGSVTIDPFVQPPFHRTEMGSGAFPSEGVYKACYMRNLNVYGRDVFKGYADIHRLRPQVTDSRCYDVKDVQRSVHFGRGHEPVFTVGGPGWTAPPR